jgi:hypothetical protein
MESCGAEENEERSKRCGTNIYARKYGSQEKGSLTSGCFSSEAGLTGVFRYGKRRKDQARSILGNHYISQPVSVLSGTD